MGNEKKTRSWVRGAAIAFVVLGAVGAAISQLGGRVKNTYTEPPPSLAVQIAQQDLAAKVRAGPISTKERAMAEAAIAKRFPSGSRVPTERTFYFDGGPTSCGTVWPTGEAASRFIYRNGNVVVERDVGASNFQMFWQICTAAGA
ncbi:hypothetical protein [Brevundimonas nasdae]|uniref:hypothetical protein n=1 Tax=Brevundimonas nasdae TaxID=172043 RepID=UPI003F6923CA